MEQFVCDVAVDLALGDFGDIVDFGGWGIDFLFFSALLLLLSGGLNTLGLRVLDVHQVGERGERLKEALLHGERLFVERGWHG